MRGSGSRVTPFLLLVTLFVASLGIHYHRAASSPPGPVVATDTDSPTPREATHACAACLASCHQATLPLLSALHRPVTSWVGLEQPTVTPDVASESPAVGRSPPAASFV